MKNGFYYHVLHFLNAIYIFHINVDVFLTRSFRHSTRKVHTLHPAVQAQSSDFTLTITK